MLSCQHVQHEAGSSIRKNGASEAHVSLQHARVEATLLGRGISEMHGPGDVCRPVLVLAARVNQEDLVSLQRPAALLLGPVVYHRGVRADRGDRREAVAHA
eukprot:CAMPEP_0183492458 /NCGR_PEP_ID=MMETSP0370-20130417/182959_1 /TAXON_ID=268820 /ORGANISM="Peridinium aciculiferum, Strain PAER-2" /LENGTH=100 /DNA_ID=CAMNT_0025685799 /DNA_START=485 /DNA_END=787 /DNA_ORIENTATION=-